MNNSTSYQEKKKKSFTPAIFPIPIHYYIVRTVQQCSTYDKGSDNHLIQKPKESDVRDAERMHFLVV